MITIEFIKLTDNTHYRAVKSIFHESFDIRSFPRNSIIQSWKIRDPHISYGFYDADKKELIGFILARYEWNKPNVIYISYLAIRDSEKGRGIGTSILKQVVRHYTGFGSSVSLVPCYNTDNWYQRNGFYYSGKKQLMVYNPYRTRRKMSPSRSCLIFRY